MNSSNEEIELLSKMMSGEVTHRQLFATEVGRSVLVKALMRNVEERVTSAINEDEDQNAFPLSVRASEREGYLEFLANLDTKPSRAVSGFPLAQISRVVTLHMLLKKIGAGHLVSSVSNLIAMFPDDSEYTVKTIIDRVGALDMCIQGVMRHAHGLAVDSPPEAADGVYDGFRDFSLSDVISEMRGLVGERRKMYLAMPHSPALFNVARDVVESGIGEQTVILKSGWHVRVGKDLLEFAVSEHSYSYCMSTRAYVEALTRSYVATKGGFDVSIEVDSMLPGIVVLKLSEVPKEFRRSAEVAVRTAISSGYLGDRTKVIQWAGFVSRKFLIRKKYVSVEDWNAALAHALRMKELDFKGLLSYVSAKLGVTVTVGPNVVPTQSYDAETVVALAQAAYIKAFISRYNASQLISMTSKECFSSLIRSKTNIVAATAIVTAVAATTGISVEVAGTRDQFALAVSSAALFGTVLSKALTRGFELVAGFLERHSVGVSIVKEYDLGWNDYPEEIIRDWSKPLLKGIFGGVVEVDSMHNVECGEYVSANGLYFLKVKDGDIFDIKGNKYIRAVDKVSGIASEEILFSIEPGDGLRFSYGELWCSKESVDPPKGYIKTASGFRTLYGMSGLPFSWYFGDPDSCNGTICRLMSEEKSVCFVPEAGCFVEAEGIYVVTGMRKGVIAPYETSNEVIAGVLRVACGFNDWCASGYVLLKGNVRFRGDLKRIGRYYVGEGSLDNVPEDPDEIASMIRIMGDIIGDVDSKVLLDTLIMSGHFEDVGGAFRVEEGKLVGFLK
jgi:hypothetical protein